MPEDFNKCVSNGGHVITRKRGKNQYQHFCKDSKGWHAGEVKTKENAGSKK